MRVYVLRGGGDSCAPGSSLERVHFLGESAGASLCVGTLMERVHDLGRVWLTTLARTDHMWSRSARPTKFLPGILVVRSSLLKLKPQQHVITPATMSPSPPAIFRTSSYSPYSISLIRAIAKVRYRIHVNCRSIYDNLSGGSMTCARCNWCSYGIYRLDPGDVCVCH